MTNNDATLLLSVEEIRKKIEATKNQIIEKKQEVSAKLKANPIDRFTNIDELLVETIDAIRDATDEQRETNATLQRTNQILLAMYFQEAPDGTITRTDNQQAQLSSELIQNVLSGGTYITRVVTLTNKTIIGKEIIFEKEFTGAIAEIVFQSSDSSTDNKSYGVKIITDNEVYANDTWDNFNTRSGIETDMAAFDDDTINNAYILQFQNIGFEDKIVVEVFNSSASFTRIYIKYHRQL